MDENVIRLVLLLVGAVIILGILWDGLRRKKRNLLLNDAEQCEIRRRIDDVDDLSDDDVDDIEIELDLVEVEEFEESIGDDEILDDEESYEDDMPEDEMMEDDISEDEFDEEGIEEDEISDDEFDDAPISPPKKPSFISIRIMAKPGHSFGGYNLLQFLLANHLDYGEMKLFHRYADDNKKEKLFSLASLNEPGDFELSKMNDLECDGLILYMHPGNHKDPLSVFEMMLDTAHDLAQDLRGELMSGKNKIWTDETTEEIREALEYTARQ